LRIGGTAWRRPVGCLELQVIFRKRTTNYRALLRKMTDKIRHSIGVFALMKCNNSNREREQKRGRERETGSEKERETHRQSES